MVDRERGEGDGCAVSALCSILSPVARWFRLIYLKSECETARAMMLAYAKAVSQSKGEPGG